MLSTFSFAASLVVASASASNSLINAAAAELDSGNIAEHVRILASDEFEGRFPGTQGEERTVQYIASHFRSLDLQPVDGEDYFQPVGLFGTRPAATPEITLSGGSEAVEIHYGQDFTLDTTREVEGIDIQGSDLIFAGYGIQAPEYDWDDFAGVDVRGKTVLFLWGDPGSWGGDPSLFAGQAMSRHGMNFAKIDTLGRLGAAAVIAIHQEERAGWPWAAVSGQENQWSYQLDDPAVRAGLPPLDGLMSYEAASRVLAAAGLDLQALSETANSRNFRAIETGLKLSARFAVEHRRLGSRNVLAMLPGSERPDEYVIYTAHWDHVGTRSSGEGSEGEDRVFNGAVDNATGTAMLMEIARVFAGLPQRPARSVIFLATTAEENGLMGSQYFVANAPMPLASIQGVVNMDASFPFGSFRGMTVTGLGNSELEIYLAEAASHVDRVLQADSSPQMGAFFRSDHYPFVAQGVPALFAVGGPTEEQIEAEPELLDRFLEYGQSGYHKVGDEYDPETWDMRALEEDAEVYLRTGLAVAQDERRPNWFLDSEFRAIRDAQSRK